MFSTSLTAATAGVSSLRSFVNDGSTHHSATSNARIKLTEPSMMKDFIPNTKYHAKATDYPPSASSYLQQHFKDVSVDASGNYIAAVSSDVLSGSIYVSTNGGNSYTLAKTTTYQSLSVQIAANAPQYMLFGCLLYLYVSTDFGQTLTASSVTNPYDTWGSVSISGNGQYAYALPGLGYQSQIYASSNFLGSFAPLANSPDVPFYCVATSIDGSHVYAVANTNQLYYSTNAGLNWATITVNDQNFYNNPSSFYFNSLSTSNNGQYVAMTDVAGSVLFSNDYGSSFRVTSTDVGVYIRVAVSSSGQYIFAGNVTGMAYSNDYGATYMGSSAPPVYYYGVATVTGTTVVACSREGAIYKSTDAGVTWTPNSYDWFGVAMSQNGQTTIAISGATLNGFASMTTDSGTTWLQAGYYPEYLTAFYDVACDATCTNMVATDSISYRVFVTSDGGNVWYANHLFYDTPDYYTYTAPVVMSANGQYIVSGGINGKLYLSNNGGTTFTQAVTPKHGVWTGVAMSNSGQYAYAALNGSAIIKSTDYAVTWTKVNDIDRSWSSLSCDQAGENILATVFDSSNVFVSHNYGSTWTSISIPFGANWVDSAISGDGQYMYIVATGQNAGVIYASTNSGSTWSQLASAPLFSYKSIACDSTGQYVTAVVYPGQVYRSSNYGATWTAQNIVFKTTNDFGSFVFPDAANDDDSSDSLSGGAIAGIVIAVIIFCGVVAGLIGYFYFGLCASNKDELRQPLSEVQFGKA